MKLIITVGVPGSGKTTWALKEAMTMGDCLTISRDDLRRTMFCAGGSISLYKYTKAKEKMITNVQRDSVISSLKEGKNIIVHNTHLHENDIQYWKDIAKEYDAHFEVKYFDVSIVDLLRTNFRRGAEAVSVSRLWHMYKNYRRVRYGWVPAMDNADKTLPKCVIFDVDGTLMIMGNRSPYDFTKVLEDLPNEKIIELYKMYKEQGFKCVVVSGREGNEQCRTDTLVSLYYQGIYPDAFFMREPGDSRPDIEIKEEILLTKILPLYYPVLTVDDRDTPVGMWRINGLTCLQVGYGDF